MMLQIVLRGEESTCVELNSLLQYEVGTIIKYNVASHTPKYFYVIQDDGDHLIMQQRENTVTATMWNSTQDNTQGPLTILSALEDATSSWTNVNDQTYTMGVTTFKDNAYTGCYRDDTTKEITCTVNTYTLPERTGKARMITAQETGKLGCQYGVNQTCPIWMYNYLYDATKYGGTNSATDYGYWTMSARSSNSTHAMSVYYYGYLGSNAINVLLRGARAVVEINKYI